MNIFEYLNFAVTKIEILCNKKSPQFVKNNYLNVVEVGVCNIDVSSG